MVTPFKFKSHIQIVLTVGIAIIFAAIVAFGFSLRTPPKPTIIPIATDHNGSSWAPLSQDKDCSASDCVDSQGDQPAAPSAINKNRTSPTSKLPGSSLNNRYSAQVFDSIIESKDIFFRSALNDQGTMSQLYMNIYQPAGDTLVKRPTLIFLHEGGWCFGDRNSEAESAKYYARLGYVTATIEYRLSVNFNCRLINGEIPYDEDLFMLSISNSAEDLVAAIAFLKSRYIEFGIDTNKIANLGWSAGGMSVLRTLAPDYSSDDRANVSFAMGATINDLIEARFGPFVNTPPLLLINANFDEQWVGPQPDVQADCQRLNVAGGDCTGIELAITHGEMNFIRFSEYIAPFLKHKLGI